MSDIVIQVENIGKKYLLRHQAKERYIALRDVMAAKAAAVGKRLFELGGIKHKDPTREEFWALRDVSFEVKKGEVVGIIGRNGAGKSTLLKILSRITEPTSGKIRIKGRVASLLEVGTGFHPELTGRENIYLNGAILGMSKSEIRRKFDEIVSFAEVEKFLDTPVKRYSSGMYVRLAFAVAAHLEPEILLVDEVLAVGDTAFQKKCLGKMDEVSKGGRTVIFISHSMPVIQGICCKGIVLDHGSVVYKGNTRDAVTFYLSNMIQKFGSDLRSRTDRKGSHAVRFTQVEFTHKENGKIIDPLISGVPVRIELQYELNMDSEVKNLDVSIGFFNSLGTLLFACRSSAIGKIFDINGQTGFLYCDIPKWPLSSGTYTYNIYAEQNGMVCDWIQEAGQVVVESGDYYGTGKVPASSMQSIFIDYDWKIK